MIEQIKKLYDTDITIFAICLGHQLIIPLSYASFLNWELPETGPLSDKSCAADNVYFSRQVTRSTTLPVVFYDGSGDH